MTSQLPSNQASNDDSHLSNAAKASSTQRDGAPSSSTYAGARSSSTYTSDTRGYPTEKAAGSASKPLTLRAAIKACDVDSVHLALQKLRDLNAEATEAALDATDGMGRTVLHICAANARRAGTGDVVRLLLESKARTDVRDANEKNPLDVAVAAASVATEATEFPPATATVSHLLAARACASRDWAALGPNETPKMV